MYSASNLAIEEFPDLTVEKRSAVSIGRRVQDPLSELVKIDPKSIGVGEYQYDVNQKNLGEALDYTVENVVNKVGVNINTASSSILKRISGMTKKAVESIMAYKVNNKFTKREELKSIKGITPKIYEQSVGFLRVIGVNPLDNTGVHPESYNEALKVIKYLNLDLKDIQTNEFKEVLNTLDINKLNKELNINIYLLESIIKGNILTINDLKVGEELEGTVRNVASFGAFIDIGLHDDALLHISKMSKKFVSDPLEIVNVGDIVKFYVDKIEKDKNKVSLTLIKEN